MVDIAEALSAAVDGSDRQIDLARRLILRFLDNVDDDLTVMELRRRIDDIEQ